MRKTILALFWLVVSLPLFSSEYGEMNNKAISFYKSGRMGEALLLLDKAILANSKTAILYNNRGFIKSSAGDYYGALSDFNQAIDLDNDPQAKALAYFNRANLKTAKEDYDGAIKDYTNAILLKPKFPGAFKARAEAKQKSAEADLKRYAEIKD